MKTVVATLLAAVAGSVVAGSNITCAKGLYMLAVRGSGEPQLNPNSNPKYKWPLATGTVGLIAVDVQNKIKGSIVAGVNYEAFDPVNELTGAVNLTGYYPSEGQGAKNFMDDVIQYHSACPDSKIALLGYSQGAQIVRDGLCGGLGGKFNSGKPFSPDLIKNNVVAIALLGDPTHVANEPINRGTGGNKKGQFPRQNLDACKPYYDMTASWCDAADPICALGNNMTVHGLEAVTHLTEASEFIVQHWQNATSGGASASSTSTSTGAPASSPSAKTASASGMNVFQAAILRAVTLIVLLAFN